MYKGNYNTVPAIDRGSSKMFNYKTNLHIYCTNSARFAFVGRADIETFLLSVLLWPAFILQYANPGCLRDNGE